MTDQHLAEGCKQSHTVKLCLDIYIHYLLSCTYYLLLQGRQAWRQYFIFPSCREGNLFLIMINKQVTSNTKILAFLNKQYQSSLQKYVSGFNWASVIQNLMTIAKGVFTCSFLAEHWAVFVPPALQGQPRGSPLPLQLSHGCARS